MNILRIYRKILMIYSKILRIYRTYKNSQKPQKNMKFKISKNRKIENFKISKSRHAEVSQGRISTCRIGQCGQELSILSIRAAKNGPNNYFFKIVRSIFSALPDKIDNLWPQIRILRVEILPWLTSTCLDFEILKFQIFWFFWNFEFHFLGGFCL